MIDTASLCGWTDMIGCDISRLWVSKWGWKVCVCETEWKERGFMILVLRNVMCLRSCEPPLALWVTFSQAIMTWPGSGWGHLSGQKARLCWQHPFQSIHNSHSSTSWEPYSLAAWFKGLCPHRKRHTDKTDQSIESHCWHCEYQEAGFYGCALRGKLPPGSAAVV